MLIVKKKDLNTVEKYSFFISFVFDSIQILRKSTIFVSCMYNIKYKYVLEE